MKKLGLLIAVVAVLGMAVPAFGAKNSHYDNGDFCISVGVGAGTGFSITPGIYLNLGEFTFTPDWGLDWGIMARGLFGFYNYGWFGFNYNETAIGAGAYFTVRWGLKTLGQPFLEDLDIYYGAGFRFAVFSSDQPGYTSAFNSLGFSTIGGVNWNFSKNMSLYLEYSYIAYSYATIGIQFKL